MYHSMMLFFAIIAEVAGTISMRYSAENNPISGTMAMILLIGLSYFLLSKAIQKIPLGVAYAIWEGVGILLITVISSYLFDEYITPAKIFGVGLIVAGLIFINTDEGHNNE
ncbi:MAG: multidrug efflux SMR transporter [Moritella sp.]|uniref:DMT family transporter n=1 Tax=Moritella sp. TaxID=78556 RepID=UPI0025D7119B|nr:multidrug efflux SMR transporter [Moritella sp.]NQZ94383.1 multidrug efflux SMR transporter [Moritella sp.]